MSKKIKVCRDFIYKAYLIDDDSSLDKTSHAGQFIFKSECHYYVEKHVLDLINNNQESYKDKAFVIFNISSLEDSTRQDYFIESIKFDGQEIKINI